jgi:two-component system torCAD operon response regulator TorR
VPAHVVIVEDEPVTRALVKAHLEQAGYRVTAAELGAELRALLRAEPIDLVVLDIELADAHGFQLGAELRATSNVGLIFLTRRTDVVDRVVGLEIGADDYVTKPVDMRELVARVRAVLRRRSADTTVRLGEWQYDRERCCLVGARGDEKPLTQGEQTLLVALLDAKGRVVLRQTLADALAAAVDATSARSVDVLVHRLRKKLGEGGNLDPRILLTVHGVGYRLVATG